MSLPLATADEQILVDRCLSHLEREAVQLEALKDALAEVRGAIMRNDLRSLADALARQEELTAKGDSIQRARERLRWELADTLDISIDQASLQTLAERTGDARLKGMRQRVRQLAEHVEDFNQVNATLVRRCLDFHKRVLLTLTGGDCAGTCYGPAGQVQEGIRGFTIEARG